VRPEFDPRPSTQATLSHAASKKRKVSHGDPPPEVLLLRSGATVGELKAAASAAFGEVYHCLRNFQAEAVVAGLPPKSKDSMQLYPDSIPANVTVRAFIRSLTPPDPVVASVVEPNPRKP
jgi:hypothetical protein